eukprot:1158264-Pelagomonas_calceolata.AAC.5
MMVFPSGAANQGGPPQAVIVQKPRNDTQMLQSRRPGPFWCRETQACTRHTKEGATLAHLCWAVQRSCVEMKDAHSMLTRPGSRPCLASSLQA